MELHEVELFLQFIFFLLKPLGKNRYSCKRYMDMSHGLKSSNLLRSLCKRLLLGKLVRQSVCVDYPFRDIGIQIAVVNLL